MPDCTAVTKEDCLAKGTKCSWFYGSGDEDQIGCRDWGYNVAGVYTGLEAWCRNNNYDTCSNMRIKSSDKIVNNTGCRLKHDGLFGTYCGYEFI